MVRSSARPGGKGRKAVQAEGRALQRYRGREHLGWGSLHGWEGVTYGCGGGGRWGQKDQIFLILLSVQAPSKRVLSWGVAGSNLSSMKEGLDQPHL